MKVINTHKRVIQQPKDKISEIFNSLSTNNDLMWPKEKWPPMIFKKGLIEGAIGGHRPIIYSINSYMPGSLIEFNFIKPDGFVGIHKFEITEIEKDITGIKHTIDMTVSGKGIFTWYFAIKWLHDALLEDCMDKVENNFQIDKKKTKWNIWVILLRRLFRRKK